MSEDPLEKAVLSGALLGRTGEKDPDAEPHRPASPSSSRDGESDNEDLAFQAPPVASSVQPARSNGARKGVASQTGPKGVLTDFKSSEANKHNKRTTLEFKPSPYRAERPASDSEDDSEDEADAAAQAYMQQRMGDMRLGSGERTQNGSGKIFGQLREINAASFEKAVLDEEVGVKVIVHLYEPDVSRCAVLNHHLITLAHQYPYCKFLIVSASDLDFAADSGDVVLPTLLVYEDGELIANLVAVDQAWGRKLDYSVDEVKRVLVEHNILRLKSGEFLSVSASIQNDEGDDLG